MMTNIFVLHHHAVELMQKLSGRIAIVTENPRETGFTCSSGCQWLYNQRMQSPSTPLSLFAAATSRQTALKTGKPSRNVVWPGKQFC